MSAPSKILVASGHTGGHFFPAVCFAEAYQEKYSDSEIWFLLARHSASFDVERYLWRYHAQTIPLRSLPGGFSLKLIFFLIHYVHHFFLTLVWMAKLKPSVVVSFGSYSTLAAVLAAWVCRVPIVVHEQNRISGWTNRMAAFFARHVATSFPETLGCLPSEKVTHVGYPIRPSLRAAACSNDRAHSGKRCSVLVLGGSQGSEALNRISLDFFSSLSSEEKERFAVIHITGEKQYEAVRARYLNLNVNHQVFAFTGEIENVYSRADLVIARAGAGTIFELAVFGIPSVLIPYPFAYAHQSKNAEVAAEAGGAVVIEEKELTAAKFSDAVMDLARDPERRQRMGQALKRLDCPNAGPSLAALAHDALDCKNSGFGTQP